MFVHTVSEVTERASQSGYRLIDTAWCYGMLKMQRIVLLPYPIPGTEKATGEAIKKSGIPRDQIWITTKLQ